MKKIFIAHKIRIFQPSTELLIQDISIIYKDEMIREEKNNEHSCLGMIEKFCKLKFQVHELSDKFSFRDNKYREEDRTFLKCNFRNYMIFL